jgi:hypothetical protein
MGFGGRGPVEKYLDSLCVDLDTEVTEPTKLNANPQKTTEERSYNQLPNCPHLCAVEILTSELLRRSDFWIVIYAMYFLW